MIDRAQEFAMKGDRYGDGDGGNIIGELNAGCRDNGDIDDIAVKLVEDIGPSTGSIWEG